MGLGPFARPARDLPLVIRAGRRYRSTVPVRRPAGVAGDWDHERAPGAG